MAARKKIDPIKQREKRAKIAAVGGVVLLLAVAAWQGPKMMKLMHQKPVVPATSAAPAGALPGTDGTTAATGTTAAGELADTDIPPAAMDDGQLVAFDVFETKDPFRPQVTNADLAASAAPSTATQSAPGTAPGAASSPATTTPATEPTTATSPATAVPSAPTVVETTPTAKPAPTVAISVNGATSHVAKGGTFPSGTPVFRLVSWTKDTARIGIVGGSYATGEPTLELTLDRPVTLQNTSNGQRYKLILLSTP